MTDGGWSDEAQRLLDGDEAAAPEAKERGRAARFAAAVGLYAAQLPSPTEDLDARVMNAVRARAASRAWWRWFVRPQRVAIRPVWAAAAAVVLMALAGVLTRTLGPGAPPHVDVSLAPAAERSVLVRFEFYAPDAREVSLAGSFNNWSSDVTTFDRGGQTGWWTVTVALEPGEHQYLFVVDGQRWMPDPGAHAQVQDEFGQVNSLLVVGPRGVVRS
jgi:hypothetical protein